MDMFREFPRGESRGSGRLTHANAIFCGLMLLVWPATAQEPWAAALASMPLSKPPGSLTSSNCVETVLGAFRSNATVKAVIFMPGATDELYMFKRVHVALTNAEPNLLHAVISLTNQSHIRAAFKSPFLLLHTEEDILEPKVTIEDGRAIWPEGERGRAVPAPIPHLLCNDRDWDFLQPILKRALRLEVRPWRHSRDSWHFYRHSLAGWNLTAAEALAMAALSGKTQCTIRRHEVVFEVDPRVGAAPNLQDFRLNTSR